MVKEVVQVDDGFTLIQESIFNKDYSDEEEVESDFSENDDNQNPENEVQQPDCEEDDIYDEEEQHYNNDHVPGTGIDELIQPMLAQED